jgi:peptide/nickel transport system ATP-binding protein
MPDSIGSCGPMNVLEVRDLRKCYETPRGLFRPRARTQALDGVTLDIQSGSTQALVGESGSGKTTLARCLVGLERPDAGEIWFEGEEVFTLAGVSRFRLLRREVQLVFQDPASALSPRLSAAEIVEEPLTIQKICGRDERRRRALELMDQVGLPPSAAGRSALELSGGQRQRLAIARSMILEPKLLVLDEAFSGLDLSIQAQLVNLLLDLQAARPLSCLFILHDLGLAAGVADRIAVMHKGRIVETLRSRDWTHAAHHPQTRALLDAIP